MARKPRYEETGFWPSSRQSMQLIRRALYYCDKHNLKRSEITRNALVFYLDYINAPRFQKDTSYRDYEDSELQRVNAEIEKLANEL